MRGIVGILILVASLIAAPTAVMAQMDSVSITVTYKERIALPPEAQLDIQIHDLTEAGLQLGPISAQRFGLIAVPKTVVLTYDPRIVGEGSRLAVVAAIRGPDGQQMFRAIKILGTVEDLDRSSVEILLAMLPDIDPHMAVPRRISGVPWTVTEVFGEAWPNEDPATLVLDDEMNFALFGGCNRFSGRLAPSGGALIFPEDFAGTMMACPDPVEAMERQILAALRQVADFVRYGSGLVMMDANGRAVLHFVATPE